MKASIIIACANDRTELLQKTLGSLARQKTKHEVEIIALNDGDSDNGIEEVVKAHTAHATQYKYMGNKPGWWRTPATAFNTGAKMANGEIFILTCPEIYSVDDTLDIMIDACDGKYMVIPYGMDDRDGRFLNELKTETLSPLKTQLPFFMGVRKCDWDDIGGYDEAMTGISFDDDDFVARMLDSGATYKQAECNVIHLYHPRISDTIRNNPENRERWLYNKAIFDEKRRARNFL